MGKSNEKSAWQLDRERILGDAIRTQMHATPTDLHIKRAAEAVGLTADAYGLVPSFETVAALLVWVQSVKAAGGNVDSWRDFADRLSPKPSRPAVAVNVNTGPSAPVASQNSEEQTSAESYYGEVMNG